MASPVSGLRFPVATVVAMLADGMAPKQILAEHPDLTAEDIHESLLYAAKAVREREKPATAHRQLSFAAIGQSTTRRGAAEADGMLTEGFGRDLDLDCPQQLRRELDLVDDHELVVLNEPRRIILCRPQRGCVIE